MRRAGHSTEVRPSPDETLVHLAAEISDRLELRACWYEPFPFDALLPRIEADRIVLPAEEPGARPYAQWYPGAGIELPVRFRTLTLGRFVLLPREPTCGVAISVSSRADALAIAECAGRAIACLSTSADPVREH